MFVIVGLGNPTPEYAKTRHNAGFIAVDEIAHRFSFDDFKKKDNALISIGQIAEQKVILVKPLTYMNLSGEAVGPICHFYKILPQNVIVFHDDIDLKVADIRIKKGGSSAGHNGIKNIDKAITSEYWRVRIGVGKSEDTANYVLGNFPTADLNNIQRSLDIVFNNLDIFFHDGGDAFSKKVKDLINGI